MNSLRIFLRVAALALLEARRALAFVTAPGVELVTRDVSSYRLLAWIWLGLIVAYVVVGLAYGVFRFYWNRRTKPDAKFVGPLGFFLRFMVKYPCLTLLLGLAQSLAFSAVGLYASDFEIPVDWGVDGYIDSDSDIRFMEEAVARAVAEQNASLASSFRRLAEQNTSNTSEDVAEKNTSEEPENVAKWTLLAQSLPYWTLDVYYTAKNEGGNVFTKDAIAEIKRFEQELFGFAGYEDFCLVDKSTMECSVPSSVVSIFSPSSQRGSGSDLNSTREVAYDGQGECLSAASIADTVATLKQAGVSWWWDTGFDPFSVNGSATRSQFRGGGPLKGVSSLVITHAHQDIYREFLHSLSDDFLTKANYDTKYVTISWQESRYMEPHEIFNVLLHDVYWSAGSFLFVLAFLLFQLRSVVLTIVSAVGVFTSFTTAFYWYRVVAGFETMNLMNFISLFLIIGIAADDVLVIAQMYDLGHVRISEKRRTPQNTMKWAYYRAGSATLVTTVTTCGSFFALCTSSIKVLRAFGFFMGATVAWNYINVMIIFPPAVLMVDMWWKRLSPCCVPNRSDDGDALPDIEACSPTSSAHRSPSAFATPRHGRAGDDGTNTSRSGGARVLRDHVPAAPSPASVARSPSGPPSASGFSPSLTRSMSGAQAGFTPRMTAGTSGHSLPRRSKSGLSAVTKQSSFEDSAKVNLSSRVFRDCLGLLIWHLRWPLVGCFLPLCPILGCLAAWRMSTAGASLPVFSNETNIGRQEWILNGLFGTYDPAILREAMATFPSTAINVSTCPGVSEDGCTTCSGHGTCSWDAFSDQYACSCDAGWFGEICTSASPAILPAMTTTSILGTSTMTTTTVAPASMVSTSIIVTSTMTTLTQISLSGFMELELSDSVDPADGAAFDAAMAQAIATMLGVPLSAVQITSADRRLAARERRLASSLAVQFTVTATASSDDLEAHFSGLSAGEKDSEVNAAFSQEGLDITAQVGSLVLEPEVVSSQDGDSTLESLEVIAEGYGHSVPILEPLFDTSFSGPYFANVTSVWFKVVPSANSSFAHSMLVNGEEIGRSYEIEDVYPARQGFTITVTAADRVSVSTYFIWVSYPAVPCSATCHYGSRCSGLYGRCECSEGFFDGTSACSAFCPGSGHRCSGHGRCCDSYVVSQSLEVRNLLGCSADAIDTCACDLSYTGEDCSQRECPECQNGRPCLEGTQDLESAWTCDCGDEFWGSLCEHRKCPNDCSGNGVCDTGSGECACNAGWGFVDCSWAAPTATVPIDNAVEVQLVWGIAEYDESYLPVYDQGFGLDHTTQRWLLDTCTAARAQEGLRTRTEVQCWIEKFAADANATVGFPVGEAYLSEQLESWFGDPANRDYALDVGTAGTGYSGQVRYAQARMRIDVRQSANAHDLEAEYLVWADFVDRHNAGAPAGAKMLMVSSAWTRMDTELTMVRSSVFSVAISMTISFGAVALFTGNLLLSCYVVLTIMFAMMALFFCLIWIVGMEFGPVQIIGLTTFVGLSVDYTLHACHSYNDSAHDNTRGKATDALMRVGPAILGGALTTVGATIFLYPCWILPFYQLGVMIFLNTLITLALTLFFLMPLLMVAGPRGECCDLHAVLLCRPIRRALGAREDWGGSEAEDWCCSEAPDEDVGPEEGNKIFDYCWDLDGEIFDYCWDLDGDEDGALPDPGLGLGGPAEGDASGEAASGCPRRFPVGAPRLPPVPLPQGPPP